MDSPGTGTSSASATATASNGGTAPDIKPLGNQWGSSMPEGITV